MGDNNKDPVDHSRTTRSHAGESMKVRSIEERWFAEHPEAHRQRPSS